MLLAVDRLDYTKGVPERLRAYAHLLRSTPDLKEKVVLIQVAVPTREGINAYQDCEPKRTDWLEKSMANWARPNGHPLVYINRSIDQTELVGLYKLADVSWIGSLRDGMNLVAKRIRCLQTRW